MTDAARVPLRSSLDACAFVDELGASAIGEIIVSDVSGRRGTVFVEGGRVCWAAARGLARRLSELLVARASVPPSAMQSMFVACKEQRIPLGEHLVGRGVLSADALRQALLQHTVESLSTLCDVDARGSWFPHSGTTYRPQFTFATGELLAEIGKVAHAPIAERVQPVLAQFFNSEGDWATAFVRTRGNASPEPVAMHGDVPHVATELVRLGKWAASVLDIAGAFSDPNAMLSLSRGDAETPRSLVAFRFEDAFVAGETGPMGPARILNHRAAKRREKG